MSYDQDQIRHARSGRAAWDAWKEELKLSNSFEYEQLKKEGRLEFDDGLTPPPTHNREDESPEREQAVGPRFGEDDETPESVDLRDKLFAALRLFAASMRWLDCGGDMRLRLFALRRAIGEGMATGMSEAQHAKALRTTRAALNKSMQEARQLFGMEYAAFMRSPGARAAYRQRAYHDHRRRDDNRTFSPTPRNNSPHALNPDQTRNIRNAPAGTRPL